MDGRKKILYVITKSNWGGAQRYVYDLATNLPKDKFEAVVAMGGKGLLKEKLAQSGIRVISIPKLDRDIKFFDEFYVFYRLLRLFREEKPDVIHINSSKVGGLGSFAARIYNFLNLILNLLMPKTYSLKPARIIFTAHAWAFNEERSALARRVIKLLSWLTVVFSHKTMAVSRKIFEETPSLFINPGKLALVYNGISEKALYPKEEARELLNLPKDAVVVGTMAELHKNKGLSYGIEAFNLIKKDFPSVKYVIMGEGEERKSLEKIIRKNKLGKMVYLTGFVEEAPRYLSACDIFLLPSVTEALGLSLLEAGLAGLPVVATSVGGIPEIIDDMKTGILVRPRQSKELGGAIKFLIENKEKAAGLGKNLSEKVRKEFSLEKMVRETVALYS